MFYLFRLFWLSLLSLILTACATQPASQQFAQKAQLFGFQQLQLARENYPLIAYWKPGVPQKAIHVYLDSDGTPWRNRYWIEPDPTPRNPLVLQLMAQDPAPSLYLGRPCYHGQATQPNCSPVLWTSHRYSPTVVRNMAAALNQFLSEMPTTSVILFGFSGGGTLAMLLAEQIGQTQAVITVAANLDTDRWTQWKQDSPLTGSLNPSHRPFLPKSIVQLHYVGGQDSNVPPWIPARLVRQYPESQLIIMQEFSHTCCWRDYWPMILDQINNLHLKGN